MTKLVLATAVLAATLLFAATTILIYNSVQIESDATTLRNCLKTTCLEEHDELYNGSCHSECSDSLGSLNSTCKFSCLFSKGKI